MRRGAAFLAVLLLVVLPKPIAFASPPDPTWIAGIYDGADGDDILGRTAERVASDNVGAFEALAPARRPETPMTGVDRGYRHRQPTVAARGPPLPASRAGSCSPSPALGAPPTCRSPPRARRSRHRVLERERSSLIARRAP